MQFLVSLLVPLTLFLLPVSSSPLHELSLHPRDPSPQVWDIIAPAGGSPPGCVNTVDWKFAIRPIDQSEAPARGCPIFNQPDVIENAALSLRNGVLLDRQGKVGSIVANRQFQFDGPPAQAGAIYTGGWSFCDDTLLALGPSKVFWKCMTGTFYNLYDQSIGSQCIPVNIHVIQLRGC